MVIVVEHPQELRNPMAEVLLNQLFGDCLKCPKAVGTAEQH